MVRARLNPWLTGDHTKTIVFDGGVAYLGGLNIGREYRFDGHALQEVEGTIGVRFERDSDVAWVHAGLAGDPGMTHVKAAIFDGWACFGSANFDKMSLKANLEINIGTSDPDAVGRGCAPSSSNRTFAGRAS